MNDALLSYAAGLAISPLARVEPMGILCRVTQWIHDGEIPPSPDVVVAAVAIRANEWADAIRANNQPLARAALRELQTITDAMGLVYG